MDAPTNVSSEFPTHLNCMASVSSNYDVFVDPDTTRYLNFTTQDWNETDLEEVLCFEQPVLEFPLLFCIVVYILYNVIFIIGLFGNLVVVYIILWSGSKSVKTVGNYFLANLALGDILIAGLSIPFGYIAILWQYWPFGLLFCHLVNPAKTVGVFVSSYTLIALAVDRYFAVCNNTRL